MVVDEASEERACESSCVQYCTSTSALAEADERNFDANLSDVRLVFN